MKVIAVPYFPGSNGDYDAISRIKEFGMKPLPLYFHIGDSKRLEENAAILREADGAVIPGGFPYEDRLGFGVIPAQIQAFVAATRELLAQGKPVIAFCSGNQIAASMRLAFPQGSQYNASLQPNICDRDGKIVHTHFLDGIFNTKLACAPERTAFTRNYKPNEVIPSIVDHGGGRFWADNETLEYLLANGMVVTRYSGPHGEIEDNFPVNPNGSMLNIESITNVRGNLKIGMCHNERKLNALHHDRANLVFASMREFIEEGCPDLSSYSQPQNIPINLKDYSYLSRPCDPSRTANVYIKMLTDDNERMAVEIFNPDIPVERRRLLRLEVAPEYNTPEGRLQVVQELAKMDFFDGIMLKKDRPIVDVGTSFQHYEVVSREPLVREFRPKTEIVSGFPVMHEQVSLPNVGGYTVQQTIQRNDFLRTAVTNVHTGKAWFLRNEEERERAVKFIEGKQ